MAGHMHKRGESTWRLHAFIGQDSNGRRRHASKAFHGTKKQANKTWETVIGSAAADAFLSLAVSVTKAAIGHSTCHSYLLEAVVDRYERDDHECQPSAHKRQADCH
jgi:hypothetical protein